MPKQLISITLTAEAYAESFEVLKVFITYNDDLIVLSQLNIPVIGDESINELTAEIEVDVPHVMPVRHYIIGLYDDYNEEWLPKVTYARVDRESDIPIEERTKCIYENRRPLTRNPNFFQAQDQHEDDDEESSTSSYKCY